MLERKAPLTVVIITKNEEKRIKACLESIAWADEAVVVDDESADATCRIAEEFGARVIKRRMDVEGRHRNFAYSQAKNEWVLSLDADERVSPELKGEIIKILNEGTDCAFFAIPLRAYIGNYWIRYGGWYPGYKDRLFKKGHFWYEEAGVHPRPFHKGKRGILKGDIFHYSYRNFADFLAKLNKLTTLEAEKWVQDRRGMSFFKALWRAVDRFYRTYHSKKGKKDGFVGFMVAFFAAMYQILSYAKYWELKGRQARCGY
jgi:glycosyltransferase involved in cell wall biosynthesis